MILNKEESNTNMIPVFTDDKQKGDIEFLMLYRPYMKKIKIQKTKCIAEKKTLQNFLYFR